MTVPLVSVVITTYNTGAYVTDTLDSVLAQTHRHLEIIVVDDGSTDDTVERLKPYTPQIHFLRRPHGGLAAARNDGLRLAKGGVIALLDADDLWSPDKLRTQLDIAAKYPGSGFIVCDGVEFDGNTTTRRHLISGPAAAAVDRSAGGVVTGDFHRVFVEHVGIRCPAQTLFPRAVIERIGPFRDFDAQDYDYYLRTSARYPVTFHRDRLVRWRDRSDSMSGPRIKRDLTWSRQKLAVLRRHTREAEGDERARLERQLVRSRAEAAVYYGEVRSRRRARELMTELVRRFPWPPTALPYLVALHAPSLARFVHAGAVAVERYLARCVGRLRALVGAT